MPLNTQVIQALGAEENVVKELPKGIAMHKRTPEYGEENVPDGLLGRHATADGVWGLIRVLEGRLIYRILESDVEEHILNPTEIGVVEPQIPHQVQLDGPVRFCVEFYRE